VFARLGSRGRRGERAHGGKRVDRYRSEGEGGCWIAPRHPTRLPTPEDRVEAIACLRRLRFTGGGVRTAAGDAREDRRGSSPGSGGPSRPLGLEPERRYERSRPASCSTSTSRGSAASRSWPPGPGQPKQSPDGRNVSTAGWESVHVAIDDATRLALRRGAPLRESRHRGRLPQAGAAILRPPRHPGGGPEVRQWPPLPLKAARLPLPDAPPAPPAHPPLSVPDQRQSPSAFSAPCSAAGPTAPSSARAASEPSPSTACSDALTTDDPTALSTANPGSPSKRAEHPTSRPTPGPSPSRIASPNAARVSRLGRRWMAACHAAPPLAASSSRIVFE
jgi:hypothetical protein